MSLSKFTINEFRKEFHSDDVCLDYIFRLRYSKVPCCPSCSQTTKFKRIQGRRAYQCGDNDCQYQLYPTAGTVFEKTRTPLTDWFYVIYLMASTRNGVASKEVERQLGVTYKTAFRMTHKIRLLMNTKNNFEFMKGIVEVDETYIGGDIKNQHEGKKRKAKDLMPVIALVERNGRVITVVPERVDSGVMFPLIRNSVSPDAELITDGHQSYNFVGRLFNHTVIKHTKVNGKPDYKTKGRFHTNTVEGFFSHLKRAIEGTYIQVWRKYLEMYANESAFRYTYHKLNQRMFYQILQQVV